MNRYCKYIKQIYYPYNLYVKYRYGIERQWDMKIISIIVFSEAGTNSTSVYNVHYNISLELVPFSQRLLFDIFRLNVILDKKGLD